jgi:hypothetical protein
MKIIDVYVVHGEGDDRSIGSPAWVFKDNAKAELVAKGRGWWGGTAHVGARQAIVVDGKCYLLDKVGPFILDEGPEDRLAKKAAAIAKLTLEERKLLGIE